MAIKQSLIETWHHIKKNETMPLPQHGWTKRLSYSAKQDREGEISYDVPYMWNVKGNDTNELFTKQKQTHSLQEKAYACQRESVGGRGSQGVWRGHVHTAVFKMDN